MTLAIVICASCLLHVAEESYLQAKRAESIQRLVDPTDHAPGFVVTNNIFYSARVEDGLASPPIQHAKAGRPQHEQHAVDPEVKARIQARETV